MAWPGIAEFSSAIQSPQRCFADPELSSGELAVYDRGGRAGMPIVSAGNFAAVYRVSNQNRRFAVRCFTRAVNDQHQRYGELDTFLRATLPPAFVEFEYVDRGIMVAGDWYPIVKMEWVDGEPMNKFVQNNLNTPNSLQVLAARWRGLVSALRSLNIAHNDLQHGNVMVQQDRSLRLVDYDAMFLPQYAGQASPENGHQHFQHPEKTSQNYDENADNFPSLVIYVSLLALAADAGLWDQFYNDDNLLFRKVDYTDPPNSRCFQALKSSQDETVRQLTDYLEQCCSCQVEAVPDIESILNQLQGQPAPASAPAPAATAPSAPTVSAPAAASSGYRDMLLAGQQPQPAQGSYTQAAAPPPPTPVAMPPPIPVAQPSIACPKCGKPNPANLIYCSNSECVAPLHPGNRYCSSCGVPTPVNARFCPSCGRSSA
jgi:serine/threonine protein kinase